MRISVTQATHSHAQLISDLATSTFYETYAWYNTPANMRTYTEEHFNLQRTQKELAEADTYFFVAFAGDTPIGYAKMRNAEHPPELQGKKYLEIERIYVLKEFQKQKAGYALIKACLDLARSKKLDTVWLGVWEKNTAALAFYEKVGFRKFGRHIFQLGADPQEDHLVKYDLA